jgi:two-component system nitrogen regulation response regulator NtrX
MSKKTKVLIVDDEKGIRDSLSEILIDEGYETELAEDANVARNILKKDKSINIILLDIWMPDCDGITLLKEIKIKEKNNKPIIMMSGHGTIDTAIEATKNGAFDFIEKPISLHKVLKVLSQAVNESITYPPLNLEYLKKTKIKKISSFYKELRGIKPKSVYKTILTDSLLTILQELYEADIKYIDEKILNDIDDISYFLEEKKNSLVIFKNLSTFSKSSLNVFKIIESKFKLFNIKLIIIEENSQVENNIECIAYSEYKIFNFNLFNKNDEDQLIKLTLELLEYYLGNVSNKVFKEFDISFLNKIRSDLSCFDLIYLDQLILNSIKVSKGPVITEFDYREAKKIIGNFQTDEIDSLIDHLYVLNLRDAREEFEKKYFKFHLDNKISMKSLAEISGIERTHLYRKLKQLGIKNS